MINYNQKRKGLVGPPGLWEVKRDFQIKFLLSRGLKPEHYLLDIGCGVLRGGVPIIKYLDEGHYYGAEKNAKRLSEGIKELSEAGQTGKNPHLTRDYEAINIKFDYIWSFQVLIHLADEILNNTLSKVGYFLKDAGACYATVNIGPRTFRESLKWMEYPVVHRPFSFYKKTASQYNLTVDLVSDFKHKGLKNAMLKITKGSDAKASR